MEIEEQDAAPVDSDGISGLIRRVRRLAKLSQRELAHHLGVSQSAVAKWETGRTSPSALMLARVLRVAELALAAVRADGERVTPMKVVAARDAAGRRYPAHTFVWAEGWWVPEGAESTAWFSQILLRSEMLELPRVRYSRWWQHYGRSPSLADVDDHPTWDELVAEAREGWLPARRQLTSIPEWAWQDSRKSRNRRPEDFRAWARVVSTPRSRHLALVPTTRRG
ncbi:helix-turn-helix transcriptional regulator [Nocardioides sp.]|uniref:helix-turn-helix transcriptional regulator n=1 Tax=Nocardioides sp. TaxID=35761 RepID=UPI00286E80E3|nr:helix-turn-helix transcriptional regulator [Nocardioides sp.]